MSRWYDGGGLVQMDDLPALQQSLAISTERQKIHEDDSADSRKERSGMSFEEWQRRAAEVIAHKEKGGR